MTDRPSAPPSRFGGFTELSQFTIDPRSVRLLNPNFCAQRHVVVLGVVDPHRFEPATVGMLDPDDARLVAVLEQSLGRPVEPVHLNDYEIRRALDIGFGRVVADEGRVRLELPSVTELSFAPEVPAATRVAELLALAVNEGASDVHIECYEGDVDVRLRIDGVLHQVVAPISVANVDEVIARLKVLADLDIAERRAAQDGRVLARIQSPHAPRPIDFRLSVLPGPFGEDAVLRVLDSKPLIGLERLGFAGDTLARFRALIGSPEGFVLVTGPTGSGKTTTLYSAVQEINTDANKVLTVEDPIEYHFPKVNQKQVGPKMGFADYARSFMRQDPDILLIGEIRDHETADIAVRAAQTGHLVLSTLHTNGSVGTVSRLGVLGIDPGLVADTLLGALSQRLVRRVCSDCVQPDAPDPFAESLFARLGASFPLQRGRGCEACRGTGYRGRVGLYELFEVDEDMADRITRRTAAHELRRASRARGMRSLFDDGVAKVREGLTTFDEVRAAVPHRMVLEALEGLAGE